MEQVSPDKRSLLITGTVVPNSNFVVHTNIEQRLEEYYEGLLFYSAEFPNDDIYFLENSIYDFSTDKKFQQLFSDKKITLLKFPVSDKTEQGKGYQEFEMLDNAIKQLSGKYYSFIKITGRYKVLNLFELTDFVCTGLVADCHKKTKVVQTNVFYSTMDFYNKHLKGLFSKADDSKGIFIEHVVYRKIVSSATKNEITLFASNPIITGTSGSYGGTLGRNKYKMLLRNVERKVLRILGIKQFLIEY